MSPDTIMTEAMGRMMGKNKEEEETTIMDIENQTL